MALGEFMNYQNEFSWFDMQLEERQSVKRQVTSHLAVENSLHIHLNNKELTHKINK